MFKDFLMKRARRQHMATKIDAIYKKIWDLEFLKEKMGNMRESFRMEYDRIKEMMEASEMRLTDEMKKEDPDKTIKENLENMKKKLEPDMAQLIEQMKQVDSQIEGQGGVNEQMDNYRSVLTLLKEYLRKL